MHRLGECALSGSAFAGDHDGGRVAPGDFLRKLDYLKHPIAHADDFFESFSLLRSRFDGAPARALANTLRDRRENVIDIFAAPRLIENVTRAEDKGEPVPGRTALREKEHKLCLPVTLPPGAHRRKFRIIVVCGKAFGHRKEEQLVLTLMRCPQEFRDRRECLWLPTTLITELGEILAAFRRCFNNARLQR
jgi:hypothetical protein